MNNKICIIIILISSSYCHGQTDQQFIEKGWKRVQKCNCKTAKEYLEKGKEFLGEAAIYKRPNDIKEAFAHINKALELDPEYAEAYFYKADMKWELKDYRGVIEDNSKAIKYSSMRPFKKINAAYYYRGYAKIKIGQKESGCLDLSKAGELGSLMAYYVIERECN